MASRISTEITSGGPIPLETTITYETTATCSTIGDSCSSVTVGHLTELLRCQLTDDMKDVFHYQVVRSWSSWCVIRASTAVDSSPRKREQRCMEGTEDNFQPPKKLKRIPTYDSLAPTAQEGVASSKNHGIQLETQHLDKRSSLGTRNHPFTTYFLDTVQAYRDWQMLKIRDEATRQLEKMLSGTEYCSAIALEILAQLSHKEKVLLSCTTVVVGENFADLAECQKPENWKEEEMEDFCLKFSTFVRGRWCREDILRLWVKLSKDLPDKIEAWQQPEACCTKVLKAGCDFGNYSQILKDLAHRNEHRLSEATKLCWKGGLDVSSW
ncbi:hypothetical protein BKA65DRAFT_492162 [Rhexocercosporidium sp. MPI-PUGE-AT-0058]|nr:hypothetical protein BKA65DRAFT_492162 [Rhexocercosporidium sp. MPI-PUGE-AT-0058]